MIGNNFLEALSLYRVKRANQYRFRRSIGTDCEERNPFLVLADIKKKHSSHAITADVAETARAAEFFRADGVIVTG